VTAAVPISLEVNGDRVEAQVLPRLNLADFLREHLHLTGTHVGCEHGVCGACTVRVNGEIVRSCLMLAVQTHGASVETIEGLSDSGEIADLQAAFRDRNALQCGYCTPGMLMAAQDLLQQKRAPDREEIREHLSGNYCRCTGYQAIIDCGREHGWGALHDIGTHQSRYALGTGPAEFLYRQDGAAAEPGAAAAGAGALCQRPRAAADGARGLPAFAARTCQNPWDRCHSRQTLPGVIAVVSGQELAAVITPWVGVLSHLKGLKSAPQSAIAVDRVCWQGEAAAAIVATSRAAAEDAAEHVSVEYQALDAVTDMRTALDPATPVIHPSLGDNLAFERNHDAGQVDQAFAESDEVIEADFIFGRHTGVTLEPRAVVADWNAAEARLTIYQGTQAPHMVQNIAALHLGLRESQVRVVCKDVGGSFGIKVHIYADEMATYALSKLLRRPIKSLPTASRASIPTFMPAIIAARAGSASSATALLRLLRSTISPASGPIRCIRAPARSRPTRSSIWWAVPM